MKKSFYLNDFDTFLDEFEEEHCDSLFSSLKQLLVITNENTEVYVYGMRIIIPEYHISIREGLIYDKEDETNCIDAFIVYDENEKNIEKFRDVYSNAWFSEIADYYSPDKSKKNPLCFFDEDEMVFWD